MHKRALWVLLEVGVCGHACFAMSTYQWSHQHCHTPETLSSPSARGSLARRMPCHVDVLLTLPTPCAHLPRPAKAVRYTVQQGPAVSRELSTGHTGDDATWQDLQ
jgi:hypothetical protein